MNMLFCVFSEEVILQASSHLQHHSSPSRPSQGSTESFKARLSTVVQMQKQHVQQNLTSQSDNPSSSSSSSQKQQQSHRTVNNPNSPQRINPNNKRRFNAAPPVNASKDFSNQRHLHNGSHGNHNMNHSNHDHNGNHSNHNGKHGKLGSSHATLNTAWRESEEEWSDEDREYVYYVNASQV